MIMFLALLARSGHGKSTAAMHLRAKYGAQVISLADPLKRCCMRVMDFTRDQLWGTQAQKEAVDPRYGFSARSFMQKLGTEGLRGEFGEDIHLNRMTEIVHNKHGSMARAFYVVDDTRFLNEVNYLNLLGHQYGHQYMRGATIKIVCTDAPKPAPELAAHASEQTIDSIPDHLLAGMVISSRAQGPAHLTTELDRVIQTAPLLRSFRACASDYGVKL